MKVHWTNRASLDLVRLEEFLSNKNPRVAARVVQALITAPNRLLEHPRAGERIDDTGEVELRRLFVDLYEIQYEVLPDQIRVARVFHMREER
ncbi:MAG TPA: type II toxin-antitoxin system RelE/ParE family toxin [Devosia sp.]|jgi:plasmid stabilization system protein ParE|uniref:type II toxin-antitoxin system RelE/ParE family toxin n=1 Tax=Devosia sp. TaxID=1871048 RepID=UPI002DDDBD0E|nr:type II toxin-antitoxin system RelE/ParE family toxin [Devosia sp.]HEV2517275.1 type II toxin-antitoxin system RelE/ParE family toxin [Devosia sp.]